MLAAHQHPTLKIRDLLMFQVKLVGGWWLPTKFPFDKCWTQTTQSNTRTPNALPSYFTVISLSWIYCDRNLVVPKMNALMGNRGANESEFTFVLFPFNWSVRRQHARATRAGVKRTQIANLENTRQLIDRKRCCDSFQMPRHQDLDTIISLPCLLHIRRAANRVAKWNN